MGKFSESYEDFTSIGLFSLVTPNPNPDGPVSTAQGLVRSLGHVTAALSFARWRNR